MSRRHATFDPGNAGAGLVVQNAGVQLTTSSAALSSARTARSTFGTLDGDRNVEFLPFSPSATPPSIASKLSLGLVTADASLAAAVGANADGIGYRPDTGAVVANGATLATFATAGMGDAVNIGIAFTDTSQTVVVSINGAYAGSVALPAGMVGKTLYYAASVGSDAAPGDIIVQANNGFREMQFPIAGFSGWWAAYQLRDAALLATGDYLTHHDDDFPNARFMGGITDRGFTERRSWSCWMWGEDDLTVRPGTLAFEVTDPDGYLDHLLSPVYRDQPVELAFGDHADAFNDFVSLGIARFDRMEVIDDLRRQVYFTDAIALFEGPLQQRDFGPDVDPQTANRVMPTLLGVAGSITTPVVHADVESSPSEPILQISGQDVEQVGKIREGGLQILPVTTDPLGYELLYGAQQMQLFHAPQAEITLDASRTGATYIPPAPVDALGGIGNPFADGGGGDIVGWGRYKDDAGIPDTTPFYGPVSGRVSFPQNSNIPRSHIVPETSPGVQNLLCIAGQRYRVSATVYALAAQELGGQQAYIWLGYGPTMFQAYSDDSLTNSQIFYAAGGGPQTLVATFVAAFTHAPHIGYLGSNNILGIDAEIGDVTFIELPPINDVGDDIEVENLLPGLGLADLMTMAIETNGKLPSSVWAREDAELIDMIAPTRGGGVWFGEQVTIRHALERILVGWCAGLYKGRDGRARVLRLRLPEDEIGTSPIEVSDIDMFEPGLGIRPDFARGLTRVLGVRKNYRPLTDGDQNTPALNLTQRARLAADYRYTVATGGSFAPGYDHAYAAATLDTPLWFPEDGQREIDFAGRAYAIPRAFYEFSMPFRDEIDIGVLVLLKYPRFGLAGGVPVMVVALDEDRVNGKFVRVVCWGPAPPDDSDDSDD